MEEKDNILTIDQTGSWLDILMGKNFNQYYIKDREKIQCDRFLEKVFDPWKVIAHE